MSNTGQQTKQRTLTAVFLFVTAALWVAPAHGQMPERGWQTVTVGMMTPQAYNRRGEALFQTSVASGAADVATLWNGRVQAVLDTLDEVRVLPLGAVIKRVKRAPNYGAQRQNGSRRQALGNKRFEALKQSEALILFEEALGAYKAAHVDVAEPKTVADVEFYRGLALLEAGRVDAAHVALRSMFLLDPQRVFKEGYYGKPVEDALRRALSDLASHPNPASLRAPVDKLVDLAKPARVAVWAMVTVFGSGTDAKLQLTLMDARSRGVVVSETIAIGGAEADRATDRISRILTAWHTCHTEARVDGTFVAPPRRLGVFVEVGYAHTLFIKHGTRAIFHAPGAFIGVTWEPSENFLVFGRTVQMASLPDSNQDLLEGFVTSRLAAGVGLTGGTRNIRLFLEAGLEAAVAFNDIKLTRDADCKHFGEQHFRCSGVTTLPAPGIWFGFAASLGVRARVVKSWYAKASVDVSMYVADTALIQQLNFPLSLSLGIGNQF